MVGFGAFQQSLQDEITERLNKQEAERQSLTTQLGNLHRSLDKEKGSFHYLVC